MVSAYPQMALCPETNPLVNELKEPGFYSFLSGL
jgi:hypothetical protein